MFGFQANFEKSESIKQFGNGTTSPNDAKSQNSKNNDQESTKPSFGESITNHPKAPSQPNAFGDSWNQQTVTLSLKYYKKWTAQEVASILTLDDVAGGASLSFDEVKPLIDVGFNGIVLDNIAQDIKERGKQSAFKMVSNEPEYKKSLFEKYGQENVRQLLESRLIYSDLLQAKLTIFDLEEIRRSLETEINLLVDNVPFLGS
ncbi:hypothetical protein FDP41_008980 [Naegleria fowleri]|uniref:Uncharacterized protein n=1 Tax=Naegleria fowleri TaxID=5763 RepID=A0A6A5BDV1_NAEFO|nr:uncharacterized protein FDP41_008980 [Naegleria fowleri]KAF0972731.1 hypothetical protein FDP41_008980 [Naegleria fowleri]